MTWPNEKQLKGERPFLVRSEYIECKKLDLTDRAHSREVREAYAFTLNSVLISLGRSLKSLLDHDGEFADLWPTEIRIKLERDGWDVKISAEAYMIPGDLPDLRGPK